MFESLIKESASQGDVHALMGHGELMNSLGSNKRSNYMGAVRELFEGNKNTDDNQDIDIQIGGLARDRLGKIMAGAGGAVVGGSALSLGLSKLIKKIKNPYLKGLGYLGSTVGGGVTGALGAHTGLKKLMGQYDYDSRYY